MKSQKLTARLNSDLKISSKNKFKQYIGQNMNLKSSKFVKIKAKLKHNMVTMFQPDINKVRKRIPKDAIRPIINARNRSEPVKRDLVLEAIGFKNMKAKQQQNNNQNVTAHNFNKSGFRNHTLQVAGSLPPIQQKNLTKDTLQNVRIADHRFTQNSMQKTNQKYPKAKKFKFNRQKVKTVILT